MFIPHKDAQLYTVEFGSAPRIFVAHGGWTGSWKVWTETFSQLSQTWRTVAYDYRGTGATICPANSISVESMVDDLFAVLGAESAGGMVALSTAVQQPERFEVLVLVDVLYYREKPDIDTPFDIGLKRYFEKTVENFVDTCVLDSKPGSAAVGTWGRKILFRAAEESSIKLNECTYGIDLRSVIHKINTPSLVIQGDGDKLVPVSDAKC